MKKFAFLFLVIFAACSQDPQTDQNTTADKSPSSTQIDTPFEVDLSANDKLDFEKLRIYPIIASKNFVESNPAIANILSLREAMEIEQFRVTEKKNFGRNQDGLISELTIQNKTDETVYAMTGDVVQGGKQDRMMAEDQIIAGRSIQNISVFCVEKNRWNYHEEAAPEAETDKKNKKLFAFTGYYNVASNKLRKTAINKGDQNEVWAQVGALTNQYGATTSTGTYAGLENSKDYTEERNKYLQHFRNKLEGMYNVVGLVAVSGNDILGTDVFGHPNLFEKQYESLLHGYITDAISKGEEVSVAPEKMSRYAKKMMENFKRNSSAENQDAKFYYKDQLVHFTDL